MEKPTNEERNYQEEVKVDLKTRSNEELQDGINANLAAMVNDFVARLKILEAMTGRKIDISSNAKLADGRRLHFRVR